MLPRSNNAETDQEDENPEGQQTQEEPTLEDEEDGESVYMIDGVVMQKIQIEGEPDQFLMDAEGRIYDMQANFVGTYPNNQEEYQQEGNFDNNDGGNYGNYEDDLTT